MLACSRDPSGRQARGSPSTLQQVVLYTHPTGHSSPSLTELWPGLRTLQKDLWPPVALTTHDLRCQECSARRHLVLITHARLRAPQPGICVPSGSEIDLGSSEALAGGCEEGTSEPPWGLGQGRRPYFGAMALQGCCGLEAISLALRC